MHEAEDIELPQFSVNIAKQRLSPPNKTIYVVQTPSSEITASPSTSKNLMTHNTQEELIVRAQSCEGPSSNVKISTLHGNEVDFDQLVNTSQLHQSRLGLLSQALMMIITVGFLFSETLEEFWKTK